MNFRSFNSILLLATVLVTSTSAQDDGIDIDDLFEDDFEQHSTVSIHDPLEGMNRAIFRFNDGVYNKVARPIARTYSNIVPDRAQRGISNVFTNIKFPSRFVGNVFQGRFGQALKETGKFTLNTTVGLGGVFRPSDNYEGLQTTNEDIGQAFGSWGMGHGFYLVLPFMGPTSMRDFVGDYADDAVEPLKTPWSQVDDDTLRLSLRALEITNKMPALMELYDSMRRSSIDPYSSVRDAYAQRRARDVSK